MLMFDFLIDIVSLVVSLHRYKSQILHLKNIDIHFHLSPSGEYSLLIESNCLSGM